jgi:FAD/FMN-containing dehydrogenase
VIVHPPHITRLETEPANAPEADLVVSPKTVHDVVAVLHHASDKDLTVQVLGGGSHSGYGDPPAPDIVLSMDRLDTVEAWESEDLTLVVGAGAKVSDVEVMLAERDQTAVLPEIPGESTVGGVIASGRSALRRGRLYGTRERLLETTTVTGDGRIIRAGGRVVKNVTGYDLPRLQVGAFGSLGVIVSVCLKLWPTPRAGATVSIDDLEKASVIARPLAVIEDRSGVSVFLWGSHRAVDSMKSRLGGDAEDRLAWPQDPIGAYRWSLRVPPASTTEALRRLPEEWDFVAIHGVGDVRSASDTAEGASELRSWAESEGGHLVVVDQPRHSEHRFEPWGTPPSDLQIQKDLIAEFDPARVINPGRLPGGL